MPGNPPPVDNESDGLLAYLAQQRDGLRYAAYGLTEDQLRSTPTRSALSIAGLLKHAALTERSWIQIMTGDTRAAGEQAYADTFTPEPGETGAVLTGQLEEVGRETEAAVRGLPDLGHRVQLPEAPWYPKDAEGYSARWVLLHVLEELARHAGHADIIREHIDGATMFELMAGAEGWPESPWITPWRPPAGAAAEPSGPHPDAAETVAT